MRKLLIAAAVLAAGIVGSPAWASIIGTPVSGVGGTPVASGNVQADGTIRFFIPLSGGFAGAFGVGGVGTSASYFNGSGGAGSMDMFLKFTPLSAGQPSTLYLAFEDLDLIGVNDPSQLLESVEIFDGGGTSLALIDSSSDPQVISANYDNQLLGIGLGLVGDPFYARLRFTAGPVAGKNTAETVLATVTQVPEPATLALFGIGLAGVALLARRRREAARRLPRQPC